MNVPVSRRTLLRRAGLVAAGAPLAGLCACALDAPPEGAFVASGRCMGTTYRLTVPAPCGGLDGRALGDGVRALLAAVEAKLSAFAPDAELARFNASTSTDWQVVSAETAAVIRAALDVARRSDGAFDPTIGPLVDLWGFGPAPRTGRPPPSDALAIARRLVGADRVEVAMDPPRVRKAHPGTRVDLGGIAKGHGLDVAAAWLDGLGVASYLLDLGGELRARGERAPGRRWRIGLERPDPDAAGLVGAIVLGEPGRAEGIATSGVYRQFFDADGRRHGHVLDPRSGEPIRHGLAAVSVVAATDIDADAWATALLVLGPDDGPACARRHDLAAIFVTAEGAAYRLDPSPAMARRSDLERFPC
jgi:thiamine biosynthesis lipoprotein